MLNVLIVSTLTFLAVAEPTPVAREESVQPGICFEDLEPSDFEYVDVGRCLAKCKGYKVYFAADDGEFDLEEEDTESRCKDTAKNFCEDNFGRALRDSCMGMIIE